MATEKHVGSSLNQGPFRVLFIRVSYYVGDLESDPNLGNYQMCTSMPSCVPKAKMATLHCKQH